MPDQPTHPATREDILFAIGYALRFTSTGRPQRFTETDQAAARVLEQLERNGMRIMYEPGHTRCMTS